MSGAAKRFKGASAGAGIAFICSKVFGFVLSEVHHALSRPTITRSQLSGREAVSASMPDITLEQARVESYSPGNKVARQPVSRKM
jgi:hypothetical protein